LCTAGAMVPVPSSPASSGSSSLSAEDGVPSVVEVFSSTARSWFVALVVSEASDSVTVRFLDADGAAWEKSVFLEDPRLAAFGAHTRGQPPPDFEVVASRSRPGQVSYRDVVSQRKYGSAGVAWQAYLEHRIFGNAVCEVFGGPQPGPAQAAPPQASVVAGGIPDSLQTPPRWAAGTVAVPATELAASAAPFLSSHPARAAVTLARGGVEGPVVCRAGAGGSVAVARAAKAGTYCCSR